MRFLIKPLIDELIELKCIKIGSQSPRGVSVVSRACPCVRGCTNVNLDTTNSNECVHLDARQKWKLICKLWIRRTFPKINLRFCDRSFCLLLVVLRSGAENGVAKRRKERFWKEITRLCWDVFYGQPLLVVLNKSLLFFFKLDDEDWEQQNHHRLVEKWLAVKGNCKLRQRIFCIKKCDK